MEPRGMCAEKVWEPLLYSVDNWMINEYKAVGEMVTGRRNRRIRINSAPMLFCPPKIPHDLTWHRIPGPRVRKLHVIFITPMHVTYLAHLILLYFTAKIIYKLQSYSLHNFHFYPATSFVLISNIFLSTLFSHNLVHVFLMARGLAAHTYRTTDIH
jgi:hypothetical protein